MNRYLILSLLFCSMSGAVFSQQVVNSNIEKLNVSGFNPQFTSDGKYLVYTQPNFKGLKIYSFQEKKEEVIAEINGAGYHFRIEDNLVIYENEKHSGQFSSFNIITGETKAVGADKMLQNSANPSQPKVAKNRTQLLSVAPSPDLRAIQVILADGTKNVITPLGNNDYINVSSDPSGQRLVFRVSGIGSFVSDLDGNLLLELGNVEFPQWVGLDKILYTETKDDGYNYTSSEVFIQSINDGSISHLTDNANLIAIYPSISQALDKVVFTTPEGALYLIRLIH